MQELDTNSAVARLPDVFAGCWVNVIGRKWLSGTELCLAGG